MVRPAHGRTSFPPELPRLEGPSPGSIQPGSRSESIRPRVLPGVVQPASFAARPNHIRYRARGQHHWPAPVECGPQVSAVELLRENRTLYRTWHASNNIRDREII